MNNQTRFVTAKLDIKVREGKSRLKQIEKQKNRRTRMIV